MANYTEEAFESVIEDYLTRHDKYIKRSYKDFDSDLCLDTDIFCKFVMESQGEVFMYIKSIHKEKAKDVIINDLVRALDSAYEGCLSVLRNGFKCYGQTIMAVFFEPVSGMNPDTKRLYDLNKLAIIRQARSSSNKVIDIVLTINGIPVVTMELKNPMTGQTYEHAINQYKTDRDPSDKLFQFNRRSLVNFAVDTDEVYMTTRLAKKDTYFLPFNKGFDNGKGNPINPGGYKTSYLWVEVLTRDSLLDIVSKFLHLQSDGVKVGAKKAAKKVKNESMIFPRYHQLDVVRKLLIASKGEGSGHNYLIQHSAGSGKSNSIAWVAHRLSSLHNDYDKKVFSSVVVVTDRRVLDQQLQNTISQFEHKAGVVKKIDKDSKQLAEAISTGVPIIITTLQKFPFVVDRVANLKDRTYAVIIDEAHSSMGGQSASEMRGVLASQDGDSYTDTEDEIIRAMSKRGHQDNISFFAFTATPKYKTLEIFGREGIDGKPESFHLYSMRQAIEEGFILDVLNHYTTYKAYYRLIKSIEDDPEVDKKKAALALARFISFHPYNIAQKVEVIVEHFMAYTRHKIGGMAKAMVVTSGRLHAVRYKRAIDKYLNDKGYKDIRTLVAFSGTVNDDGIEYTEPGMNQGIKETELAERFSSSYYCILIVAEKYQTGFDQPFLHSMYVDKKLSGIYAIQTLSRLNRTCEGKEDTFVLDFVNEPQDIQEAFKPYYERTIIGERVDYKKLYEFQGKLAGYRVYFVEEVNEFWRFFISSKKADQYRDHGRMVSILDKGKARFCELDDKEGFKSTLIKFRSLYSFLAQIIPFQDSDLEKLYTYLRYLEAKLPRRGSSILDIEGDVALEYYRLQKISEGSIGISKGDNGYVDGPVDMGALKDEPEQEALSMVIKLFNERYKAEFSSGDEFFLNSVVEDALMDNKLKESAKVNPFDGFSLVFAKEIGGLLVNRMGQNEELISKFLNDQDIKKAVYKYLTIRAYNIMNN